MNLNIKNVGLTVLCGILLFGAAGCKKFLAEKNKSNFTQDTYFTSAKQAESAVDGIYNSLGTFMVSNGYGERPWAALELIVGHATTLGQSLYNNQMIAHTIDPANPFFSQIWNDSYFGIANANLCIKRIPAIKMDTAAKAALLGQAHFFRAYFYFLLVRLYGDVPLITNPIDAKSPDLYPSRTSADSVYQLIVSDLQTAEQSGLPNVDPTGKISLGAVKSLLAEVYLRMAGYPLQKTEYYQKAADEAKAVIDSKWYSLFPDYADLHDNAHKNQGELILQDQYEAGIRTNSLCQDIIPYMVGISQFHDEFGDVVPTNGFYDSYEPGDLRTKEQEFYFSKYPSIQNPSRTVNFGVHALYKYFHKESALNTAQCDENWTLLRLPEIMLIYAEASNEVSGPTPYAYAQVNAIRKRAQLPPLAGLTKDQFRVAIWKERYHELCYENKAYFDIQRTHKYYDVKTNKFVDVIGFKDEGGATWTEKYLLWGIPQREIDNNTKIKQNPGW